MMRLPLMAAAAVLLASPACADSTPTLLPGTMPSLSQGRPSAQRFAPAPMPNPDIPAPRTQRDSASVEFAPGLTRMHTGNALSGDGFSHGSSYSGELDRRGRNGGVGSTLAPSLSVRVPVQVEVGPRRQPQ